MNLVPLSNAKTVLTGYMESVTALPNIMLQQVTARNLMNVWYGGRVCPLYGTIIVPEEGIFVKLRKFKQ
jgi:hypothetical protein